MFTILTVLSPSPPAHSAGPTDTTPLGPAKPVGATPTKLPFPADSTKVWLIASKTSIAPPPDLSPKAKKVPSGLTQLISRLIGSVPNHGGTGMVSFSTYRVG